VELAVNLNVFGHSVVKDLSPLLDEFLRSLNSLLGTLDLDLGTTVRTRSILSRGNVNDGAGVKTKSLHLTATTANKRRELALGNGNSGRVRVVLDVLEQAQKLVTALIGTSARALDDDLVRSLITTASGSGLARFIVVTSLLGAREVDANVVAVLETVDLATLRTNQITVVLSGDVELVSSFVLELLADVKDVLLRSVSLGLGTLDLAFAFLKLDVNIKLVAELVDVLTATTDQVASELLREVKVKSEATFKFILLLLLDESKEVLNKSIDVVLRSAEVDSGLSSLLGSRRCLSRTAVRNLGRDLVLSEGLVVTVNVTPDLVVELDRCLDVSRDDLLLPANKGKNVLLGLLQGTLIRLCILRTGCLARKLVVGRRDTVLEDQKGGRVVELIWNNQVHTELVTDLASSLVANMLVVEGIDLKRRETRRRVAADEVHDVGTGLESVLAIGGEYLP
jgi:hypothetical protein